MRKYRKKPVVIEAVHCGAGDIMDPILDWLDEGGCKYKAETDGQYWRISIETLEGSMKVNAGDWIIKGVQGEFYPCKPDIFEATYEEVVE